MRNSLRRLLYLRRLLEDVSRVELEARLEELSRIERAIQQSEETVKQMRRRSFAAMAGGASEDWLAAETVRAWTANKANALMPARGQKSVEVEQAKARYLERRKESRQVESVIAERTAAAAVERGRREQRELDDWFGQRRRLS